jgi:tetratricopeptide (TPR) repeat protein
MNHALSLNPNSADVHALRGMVLNFLGRPEEALPDLQKAFRHNPHHPDWYLSGLGRTHYMLGRPDEAIPLLEEFTRGKPDAAHGRLLLAATYVTAGRLEDARDELASYLEINPTMTIQYAAAISPMQSAEFLANYLEALRKAGLPDE